MELMINYGQYILSVIIILVVVFLFIKSIINNNKMNKLMKNTPEHRFKYLDTFFYYTPTDSGMVIRPVVYNIILDLETSKFYAISDLAFKKIHLDIFSGPNLLKGDKFKEKVNFNDLGSFWIEKEMNNNFLHFNNDEIIIDYKISKHKLKYGGIFKLNEKRENKSFILYNLNQKYDANILKETTFINGIAKFDD